MADAPGLDREFRVHYFMPYSGEAQVGFVCILYYDTFSLNCFLTFYGRSCQNVSQTEFLQRN